MHAISLRLDVERGASSEPSRGKNSRRRRQKQRRVSHGRALGTSDGTVILLTNTPSGTNLRKLEPVSMYSGCGLRVPALRIRRNAEGRHERASSRSALAYSAPRRPSASTHCARGRTPRRGRSRRSKGTDLRLIFEVSSSRPESGAFQGEEAQAGAVESEEAESVSAASASLASENAPPARAPCSPRPRPAVPPASASMRQGAFVARVERAQEGHVVGLPGAAGVINAGIVQRGKGPEEARPRKEEREETCRGRAEKAEGGTKEGQGKKEDTGSSVDKPPAVPLLHRVSPVPDGRGRGARQGWASRIWVCNVLPGESSTGLEPRRAWPLSGNFTAALRSWLKLATTPPDGPLESKIRSS
ncbi:hypothetical protein FB451DRAFT_1479018 [Mycena latifolia]|nr:hypothetical protein FB451DRAFT_1479018 [Mycena latifolia]